MKVAIRKNNLLDYGPEAPFHPPEAYPEYPFAETDGRNVCYGEVRQLLYQLGLDLDNYGKASWNPLGQVISPGDRVFIKPNFVTHKNKVGGTQATITHGSIIRAVLDYVYIALKGQGRVTVGDAPYIDTDFSAVLKATGMDGIADYYNSKTGLKLDIIDLRKERGPLKLGKIQKEALSGDPLGYAAVDLGADSEHAGTGEDSGKYRVAFYDRSEMLKHHTRDKHEYCISRSILDADVIINLPKLKTHAKTGISCSLKNLIGINGLKDWLPHHRAGPSEKGGDEYQYSDLRKDIFTGIKDEIPASKSLVRILPLRVTGAALFMSKKIIPFRDDFDAGSWYGNETLPRTITDLNRILYYADRYGVMQPAPRRKTFILVDGIVAGEKEGPMSNSARKCGMLIAGFNPVEVDIVCSAVMGFDYQKIPTIGRAMAPNKHPLFSGTVRDIEVLADNCSSVDGLHQAYPLGICPPKGWIGHIEREGAASPIEQPAAPRCSRKNIIATGLLVIRRLI